MHPYFDLLGKSIPAYGLFAGVGILIVAIIIIFMEKRSPIGRHLEMILLFELGVGLLGAKLLFIATSFEQIKAFYHQGVPIRDIIYAYVLSGFVCYGGLYGAFLGAFFYAKLNKLNYFEIIYETMILMPIFHAVGRVGCFMVGCCHGRETHTWIGVAFRCSEYAPNNVPLIPVQLFEVLANIVLLVILLIIRRKTTDRIVGGVVIHITYLYFYGLVRFVLEFFRGDDVRGFILGLSTSYCGILETTVSNSTT